MSAAASWPEWSGSLADSRKDWRYYEIVGRTLARFDSRCLLIEDSGRRAVQPYFIVDQDVTEGAGRLVRALFGWFRIRTLMVGCAAGEGHLAADWIAPVLARELPRIAREAKASLIVMKEFPSRYRAALDELTRAGFTRVPSMPMVRLDIHYRDFDDFVAKKLSKVTRKNVRRKLRAAESAEPPLQLEVLTDVTPVVDEVYPLYRAVFDKSKLRFEELTREFLIELGRRMPDKARFFVWRMGGKAVAFSVCLVHGTTLYDEYLGLDYKVAYDRHLWFYTLRDIINWGIANGMTEYVSSALQYEPKFHLRCELAPLDLYVRHTSPLVNWFMKRLLPLLEPTHSDPILKRFPNYSEVWAK